MSNTDDVYLFIYHSYYTALISLWTHFITDALVSNPDPGITVQTDRNFFRRPFTLKWGNLEALCFA